MVAKCHRRVFAVSVFGFHCERALLRLPNGLNRLTIEIISNEHLGVVMNRMIVMCALAGWATIVSAPLAAAEDFWPEGAKVYFIEPSDGAVINGKVTVKFGLSGLGVAPAGVDKPKTGHHHILVDTDAPQGPDLGGPLVADEHHRHFGGGQTETTLDLPSGPHTLQLIVGDMNHVPHDPPLISEKITVTVQ
jgi:hypothetical protein